MARELSKEQRQKYNNLLKTGGRDAAKAFRDKITAKSAAAPAGPVKGPAAPAGPGEGSSGSTGARVLSKEQRQEYNNLLKTGGRDAAKDFRDNVIVEGGGVPPTGRGEGRGEGRGKGRGGPRLSNKNLDEISQNPIQGVRLGRELAQEEFDINLAANRPNQQTIGGSREYVTNQDGSTTVVDSLDAGQQNLYDQDLAQRSAANNAFMNAFGDGQQFGQSYDMSGLPQSPVNQDLATERKRIEDSFFERDSELINKQGDRERTRIENQLYEQGNVPGTPGYEAAMQQFNEGLNQQIEGARTNAIQQGGAEFDRSFNIGTQSRQNALGEMVFERNQPLQELGALRGFGGGPTTAPNFFGFQPMQYQGPQLPQYMGMGLEAELGRGQLNVSRQVANRPPGGGAPAAPAGPSFSIGGYPDSGLPPSPDRPNPVMAGFTSGLAQGASSGWM